MPSPVSPDSPPIHNRHELLQAGLDRLDQGLTVIDGNLRIVAWNKAFLRLLDFPEDMAFVGATFESFMRYNAERGEYGPGDVEELVAERMRLARHFTPHYTERDRPAAPRLCHAVHRHHRQPALRVADSAAKRRAGAPGGRAHARIAGDQPAADRG